MEFSHQPLLFSVTYHILRLWLDFKTQTWREMVPSTSPAALNGPYNHGQVAVFVFFCARLMTEAPPLTDLCLLACLIISAPMFCLPPLSFTRRLKEHYVIYDCYQQLPGASQVQQHPRARVK